MSHADARTATIEGKERSRYLRPLLPEAPYLRQLAAQLS